MVHQLGGNYLPLDDNQCFTANSSRLVRDDDNDKSGSNDERDKDIRFSKGTGVTKQQVLEALETVVESGESDAEMRNGKKNRLTKVLVLFKPLSNHQQLILCQLGIRVL